MSGEQFRPAMTAREIDRFQARVRLFTQRGWAIECAERVADHLVLRDRDGDERRLCIECASLQGDGGCFEARRGRVPGAARRGFEPMTATLTRCPVFAWAVPPAARTTT